MAKSNFQTDPVCGDYVEKQGEFCSWVCWLHWHSVMDMRGIDIVELEVYVELEDQPFYQAALEVGG